MVEHEDLIVQHGEPIEVVGPLLVGDGRHGGLQPGDVRFQRDGDFVAKASLHAGAHRAEKPGGRRRQSEQRGGRVDESIAVIEQALAQQLEPQCEERVGQGGQAAPAGRRPGAGAARVGSPACTAATSRTELGAADRERTAVLRCLRIWEGEAPAEPSFLCLEVPEARRNLALPFTVRRGGHTFSPLHPRWRRTAGPAGRTSCDSARPVPSVRRAFPARQPSRARARRCDPHGGRSRSDAR